MSTDRAGLINTTVPIKIQEYEGKFEHFFIKTSKYEKGICRLWEDTKDSFFSNQSSKVDLTYNFLSDENVKEKNSEIIEECLRDTYRKVPTIILDLRGLVVELSNLEKLDFREQLPNVSKGLPKIFEILFKIKRIFGGNVESKASSHDQTDINGYMLKRIFPDIFKDYSEKISDFFDLSEFSEWNQALSRLSAEPELSVMLRKNIEILGKR